MWTAALSAVPVGQDGLPPELRLSPDQTELCVAAIADALMDTDLTTDELGERVISATGSWAAELVIPAFNGRWPRWRRALIPAARRGVLCFGADRGRHVTYANPARWSPGPAADDPDDSHRGTRGSVPGRIRPSLTGASRAVARGPEGMGDATLRAPRAGSRRGRRWMATRGWLTPAGAAASPSRPAGVRLLPYFDAYAVGSHPRASTIPGTGRASARSPEVRRVTSRSCSWTASWPASGTSDGAGARSTPGRAVPAARCAATHRARGAGGAGGAHPGAPRRS